MPSTTKAMTSVPRRRRSPVPGSVVAHRPRTGQHFTEQQRQKQPPWNGTDFFVAVGENNHRNWDDMRRFGFVSLGAQRVMRACEIDPGARGALDEPAWLAQPA
ncbi:MAG: hypothetical protein ACRDLN_11555 [Solirubrobacteraceae bacterium]